MALLSFTFATCCLEAIDNLTAQFLKKIGEPKHNTLSSRVPARVPRRLRQGGPAHHHRGGRAARHAWCHQHAAYCIRWTGRTGRLNSLSGAYYCALSPCGRGQRRPINEHDWVRGCGPTPHPIQSVARLSSTLTQGEMAQQQPPQLSAIPMRRRFAVSNEVALARRQDSLCRHLIDRSRHAIGCYMMRHMPDAFEHDELAVRQLRSERTRMDVG